VLPGVIIYYEEFKPGGMDKKRLGPFEKQCGMGDFSLLYTIKKGINLTELLIFIGGISSLPSSTPSCVELSGGAVVKWIKPPCASSLN
jgi:hypothetical protein